MKIVETERTILREITETDAEFILDLLNQPSFIRYIGDRGVRTVEQALEFIENRYRASYREHGFGLYTVELKTDSQPSAHQNPKPGIRNQIGICGFVKRDSLPKPDIGFAFLPEFEGRGYAFESASAILKYGKEVLGLRRVLAITTPDNESSGKLLGKLGFQFESLVEQPDDTEKLKLFSADL